MKQLFTPGEGGLCAGDPLDPALRGDAAGTTWELSDQLALTVRTLAHAAHQLEPPGGLEKAAYPLLVLICQEPRRVSDLASAIHSDVSTVSRQTSALAKLGLIEKVADPDDRRVQLVTITGAGRDVLAQRRQARHEWFETVLADWDPADVDAFRAHLARFAADIERTVATQAPPPPTS